MRARIGGAATVLALIVLGAASLVPAQADADRFGEYTPTLVVVDVSGSMEEPAFPFSDETRLSVAKRGVLRLIENLESDSTYGLIAYSGDTGAYENGCSVGQVMTTLGPLDRVSATTDVRNLSAGGDTPTGPALEHAARVLRNHGEGRGTIILLTDGDANCGNEDVCEVVRDIRSSGLDVQVNTIGIDLSVEAQEEMSCISDVSGGESTIVDDARDLDDAMEEAGAAVLSVTVQAPEVIPISPAREGAISFFDVTIDAIGKIDAKDVRVSLAITHGFPGASPITIPRPVRHLGNLTNGSSINVQIGAMATELEHLGKFSWHIIVTASNAKPIDESGSGMVREGLNASALGPLFDGVKRVLILGDSYSSGEGARHALQTPQEAYQQTSPYNCHRSDYAYGKVLWGVDAEIIACSGAMTTDFRGSQEVYKEKVLEVPQLTRLREEVLGDNPPDAIVLSIGGNDAGFGALALKCVTKKNCGAFNNEEKKAEVQDHFITRARNTKREIEKTLAEVDQALNDEEALAHRGGGIAPIIVMTYPQILPNVGRASQGAMAGCMFGVSEEEVSFLNVYANVVNTSVKEAARGLKSDGRPVYVAHNIADAVLPDHTICDDAPWAVSTTSAFKLLGNKELLHPNIEGHAAMARSLVSWSHSFAARPIDAGPAKDWTSPSARSRLAASIQERMAMPIGSSVAGISPALRPINGAFQVEASGFAPGSEVAVQLFSAPTLLGVVEADENGSIAKVFRLPEETPMGSHTIEVSGFDPDDNLRLLTYDVEVLPKGGIWLYVMIAGGLLLTLGGLTAHGIFRRRARKATTTA